MDESMRYRFQGMDPWLEDPYFWPSFHGALLIHMAETITARTVPRYVAVPGQRVVIEFPEELRAQQREPDVAVVRRPRAAGGTATAVEVEPDTAIILEPMETKQTFVEIRDLQRQERIVTVIEVLSPTNKRPGEQAREEYLRKQAETPASGISLVEIDLLRGGQHTVAIPEGFVATLLPHAYRVVVRRASADRRAEVYVTPLRQRLARMGVPLSPPDRDVVLDLQALMAAVYEAGAHGIRIDYGRALEPPLAAEDAAWAAEVVAPRA